MTAGARVRVFGLRSGLLGLLVLLLVAVGIGSPSRAAGHASSDAWTAPSAAPGIARLERPESWAAAEVTPGRTPALAPGADGLGIETNVGAWVLPDAASVRRVAAEPGILGPRGPPR